MKSRIISLITVIAMLLAVSSQLTFSASASDAGYFSRNEIEIADGIAAAAKKFDENYKFSPKVLAEDLGRIMTLVYNNHPDLFCISSSYRYSYEIDNVTGRIYVTSIIFNYTMTKEEYQNALSEVNTWVEKVVSLASPSFTALEYALFFHDYLCANYEYDTVSGINDVYNFIKKGRGVCQSYAYAYILLLEKAGVGVSWASSAEMAHVWNLVEVDGEWYHVDVTWDDPVGIVPGLARHHYFMKSDSGISTEEMNHYGWISPYRCNSDTYDGSDIAESDSGFAFAKGRWYYISDGDLYATDSPMKTGVLHTELDLRWNTWNSTSYYLSYYGTLLSFKGSLILNTSDRIIRIDPEKGTVTNVYTYPATDGYIYGFTVDMGDDGVIGADLSTGYIIANIRTSPTAQVRNIKINISGSFIPGDATVDGKVNITDASLMLKYIAKWQIEINSDNADFDRNGKVNISDVSSVLKKIAGWK